jgi:hypothetical protein
MIMIIDAITLLYLYSRVDYSLTTHYTSKSKKKTLITSTLLNFSSCEVRGYLRASSPSDKVKFGNRKPYITAISGWVNEVYERVDCIHALGSLAGHLRT